MKKTTPFLVLAGLLSAPASADVLASWQPVPSAEPGGAQYLNGTTSPAAEESVPELLLAVAARVPAQGGENAGAVWPGSVNSTGFDPATFTSFSLEVAGDAAVDFDSFNYTMNTYGAERETINEGLANEETIVSTLQLRLRSSLDNFQSDLAAITSQPADRPEANGLNFTFDLSEVSSLQDLTGPVEFRLYIWEESEFAGYDPFTWIDMATGGATFEGTVTDSTELIAIARDPLVEIFPEPKPEAGGLPPNNSNETPTKRTLDPAIESVEASRVGHGNWVNRASVWPGRVGSTDLDESSYLEVTINPAPGATFSIAEFVIPQINTYNTDDGGIWRAAIRSGLDGFSENLATTSGEGTYVVRFGLASEPTLRNLSAPLTFRVYLWESTIVENAPYDPLMWFDLVGNNTGTQAGIQVLGEARLGPVTAPAIASTRFLPGTGVQIEAIDLSPGRTYDLAITFDLSEPFTPLEIGQMATDSTLTFTDTFADPTVDTKAFYRIEEVGAP